METDLVRVQIEVTMYVPSELSEYALGEKITEFTKIAMREIGFMPTIEMIFVHLIHERESDEYVPESFRKYSPQFPYKLTEDEEWALRHQGGSGG